MSEHERTGKRDLLYSSWHRTDALKRYIGHREAFACAVIDIDWCEWCRKCKQPIALVEMQHSAYAPKDAPITAALARIAGIIAYSISYRTTSDDLDIEAFQVRQLVPIRSAVEQMTPGDWARVLYGMRLTHEATACSHPLAARTPTRMTG